MRNIPVNTLSLNLTAIEVQPKTKRSDDGVESQQVREGLPVWEVACLLREEGQKPEILLVSVPGYQAPAVDGEVTFENLIAIPWSYNGRSGVSFSASGVSSRKKAAA